LSNPAEVSEILIYSCVEYPFILSAQCVSSLSERQTHGHRHAGVRIVQEGATMVPALDEHAAHPGPLTVDDLVAYRTAREPPCQKQAINRHNFMRKARSNKATADPAG
jgi:hypothetical protein